METDARKNMADAAQAAECGCRCCCMTDYGAESLPDTVQVFSRKEVLARNYWKEHPLTAEERTVVLIGCGSTGSELLEHGLLTNVFLRGRTVSYHVFGEHSGFCALHHTIVRDLAEDKPDEDRLTFYDDAWQRHPELLAAADRIILCTDDDQENLRTYDDLHRWYPTEAKVHIRFPETLTGVTCFGRSQDIFTPEFVLRNAANRLAILMNDLYNEGSPNPTAWESLSDFLRRSNIAAADHMIVKVRCLLQDDSLTELNADLCRKAYEAWQAADPALMEQCQEMEHRRWCRFHRMYNWEYAPVRNNALRQHPLLMPYTELSEENQRKNSYAFEMLGRVAERQVRL